MNARDFPFCDSACSNGIAVCSFANVRVVAATLLLVLPKCVLGTLRLPTPVFIFSVSIFSSFHFLQCSLFILPTPLFTACLEGTGSTGLNPRHSGSASSDGTIILCRTCMAEFLFFAPERTIWKVKNCPEREVLDLPCCDTTASGDGMAT